MARTSVALQHILDTVQGYFRELLALGEVQDVSERHDAYAKLRMRTLTAFGATRAEASTEIHRAALTSGYTVKDFNAAFKELAAALQTHAFRLPTPPAAVTPEEEEWSQRYQRATILINENDTPDAAVLGQAERHDYLNQKAAAQEDYFNRVMLVRDGLEEPLRTLAEMRNAYNTLPDDSPPTLVAAAVRPLPDIPDWINQTSQPQIRTLLRSLWGRGDVPEAELFEALVYDNPVTAADTLKTTVRRANKMLTEEDERISGRYQIRQVTDRGVLRYFLQPVG